MDSLLRKLLNGEEIEYTEDDCIQTLEFPRINDEDCKKLENLPGFRIISEDCQPYPYSYLEVPEGTKIYMLKIMETKARFSLLFKSLLFQHNDSLFILMICPWLFSSYVSIYDDVETLSTLNYKLERVVGSEVINCSHGPILFPKIHCIWCMNDTDNTLNKRLLSGRKRKVHEIEMD